MKTIYVLAIPAYHEQEEIVFTYAVYDEKEEFLKKSVVCHEYRKPAIVGLYSIIVLLKEFKQYSTEEVKVIVNDGALIEQLKGTTATKNTDVLKVAELTQKHIQKYSNKITFESVASDYQKKLHWEKMLLLS
jgi:hypothetical protein